MSATTQPTLSNSALLARLSCLQENVEWILKDLKSMKYDLIAGMLDGVECVNYETLDPCTQELLKQHEEEEQQRDAT